MHKRFRRHLKKPWTAPAFWQSVALAGGLVYFGRGWYFLFHQRGILDEGLYLYKGWLFVQGIYRPFQPYGPWTNHMPLSFLIYGWVQQIFGPGLLTGRLFSLVLSLAALGILWAWIRHWAGEAWAAWGVWAWSQTVILARVYSMALTEGPAAFLMLASVALLMRRQVQTRALFLSGALAGMLTILRLNMAPVVLVLSLYALVRYGRRGIFFFFLPAVGVVLVVHWMYWPAILRLWLRWWPWALPNTPFFQSLAVHPGGEPVWHFQSRPETRVLIGAHVFRVYALPFLGWVAGLASSLHRKRRSGRVQTPFALGLAPLPWLTSLVTVLLLVHTWVTLFGPQGEALLMYMAFFAPLMLGLLPMAFHLEGSRAGIWLGYILLLMGAVVVADFPALVQWRVRWAYRARKALGADYTSLQAMLRVLARPLEAMGIPREIAWFILLGLGAGLVLAMVWLLLRRRLIAWRWVSRGSAGLLLLTVAASTSLLSGAYRDYDCPHGLVAVEAAGRALNRVLWPGDRVYWRGDPPAILLYVGKPIRLFPPQLNGPFNRRRGGTAERLYRLGYWNESLDALWFEQADVVLLPEGTFRRDREIDWQARLRDWTRVAVLPAVDPCHPGTALWVFRSAVKVDR